MKDDFQKSSTSEYQNKSSLDSSFCGRVLIPKTERPPRSKSENETSLPYEIVEDIKVGRMLLATRDIKAGEILFRDEAAAIGPDNNPKPCCLGCFKRMSGMCQFFCSKCNWPLCSENCETQSMHPRECSLFQIHKPKFRISDYRRECPSYNSIMTLRLLWLRDNDKTVWNLVNQLMDHLESSVLSSVQNDVITFIRDTCQLSMFSSQEILHILGVIDTNAYIIAENPNKDIDIQGLFPITSILNHSCLGNTICFATDDFSFLVRSLTDIKKGQELNTNYLHYHYHFFGNSYRRSDCESHWHFLCTCQRCKDPSELSTFVDGIRCQHCTGSGILLPTDSLSLNSDWSCSECEQRESSGSIQELLSEWWALLDGTSSSSNVPTLESILLEFRQVFCESHFYILEIKRRLLESIGNGEETLSQIPLCLLKKKISYIASHLEIQRKIVPGYSEYRAYLSWHISAPLYYEAKKERAASVINGEEMKERLIVVVNHLLTVITIWGMYRKQSSERRIVVEAIQLLDEIDSNYLHQNYVRQLDEGLYYDSWQLE